MAVGMKGLVIGLAVGMMVSMAVVVAAGLLVDVINVVGLM